LENDFLKPIKEAENITDNFYKNNCRVINVYKKYRDEICVIMIEIAKHLTTHNDDNFIINPRNVMIITGVNNNDLKNRMNDDISLCFKDNIFHHGKFLRKDLTIINNSLIIINEVDINNKKR
jgi:hypothetical protein